MRTTCPGMNTEVDAIEGISPLKTHIHHPHPLPCCCHCHHSLFPFCHLHHCQCQQLWVCKHGHGDGLCIGGEVVQAVGTDKAKVVMCSLQMIHHHSLILTLFATPEAEGQATSSSNGLRGMDTLEAHALW